MSRGNSQSLFAEPFLSGLTGKSGWSSHRQVRPPRPNVNSCNDSRHRGPLVAPRAHLLFKQPGLRPPGRMAAGSITEPQSRQPHAPKTVTGAITGIRPVRNYKLRGLTAAEWHICCALAKLRRPLAGPGGLEAAPGSSRQNLKFYFSRAAGIVFAVSFWGLPPCMATASSNKSACGPLFLPPFKKLPT